MTRFNAAMRVWSWSRAGKAVLVLTSLSLAVVAAGCGGNGGGEPLAERIAFSSDRDGVSHIYVMNADGSGQTRLTNAEGGDGGPTWSPDGARIAFHRSTSIEQVYVMNADGSGETCLFGPAETGWHPAWSADGAHIAFSSSREGWAHLFVMDSNGLNQARLMPNLDGPDYDPEFSPNGQRLVFSYGPYLGAEAAVAPYPYDGTPPAMLTDNVSDDREFAWSPDGTRIAFVSNRDGNWEIYAMDADDGGNVVRLTQNAVSDRHPTWSPDGSHIAFYSNRDGDFEIYVMDAGDGGGVLQLTSNAAADCDPEWHE